MQRTQKEINDLKQVRREWLRDAARERAEVMERLSDCKQRRTAIKGQILELKAQDMRIQAEQQNAGQELNQIHDAMNRLSTMRPEDIAERIKELDDAP